MNHKFIIKGRLPGLNDYLAAERNFSKKHSCGNDMKQQNQMLISNAIRLQLKRLHIDKQVHISYAFYEPDKKRDLDNIAGVAHKFIQDALVKCKVIDNDGWNNISGFDDSFFVDRHNPRIEVTIREVEKNEVEIRRNGFGKYRCTKVSPEILRQRLCNCHYYQQNYFG